MKNKTLAIRAIQKDCQLQAEYYSRGKTCAIGCLALLSGVSKDTLKDGDATRICGFDDSVLRIALAISKRFDLSLTQLSEIQDMNDDSHNDIATRRRLIVKYLKSIKTRGRE